jgi:hypothetical protein
MLLAAEKPIEPSIFHFDYPHTPKLLDQLYRLDCEAYGVHAVDRSILERWVAVCPEAITLILCDGEIAGAFGLLPVSERQIREFIAGTLREADFICLPDTEKNHRFWYWSGIVLAKKYRRSKSSPLRRLLSWGIDCWLKSDRIANNSYVLATACTSDGENLLKRFQFEQIRSAEEMIDEVPLFSRQILDPKKTRESLGELLNARS